MKIKLALVIVLVGCLSMLRAAGLQQSFSRTAFYKVMETGKLEDVNEELSVLNTSTVNEKEAYEGALLMRKAGLVKVPAEKLKLFKRGRIKLETALLKDQDNGEYHFLRLSIEEHAPKIVKYHADLESDKQHIKNSFNHLAPAVRQAIIAYSKTSKTLNKQDFLNQKNDE